MALESATYISQLVDTNPAGSDVISQGDDHLRLIKKVVQDSFPDVDQVATTIITKATAPTTQIKGTIWYDTSANLLKINTASTSSTPVWVTVNAGAPWASTSKAASCNFMATMSTYQDVPDVTATTVVYDTESWDEGTDFDHTTYKFTAPETGYYAFNVQTRWAGSGGSAAHSMDDDVWLYKNAGAFVSYTALAKDTVSPHAGYIQAYPTYAINCVMNMTAADTAHVVVRTEAGAFRITGGDQQFFSGYQIA